MSLDNQFALQLQPGRKGGTIALLDSLSTYERYRAKCSGQLISLADYGWRSLGVIGFIEEFLCEGSGSGSSR
ncbi:hypothetical protein VTL71DRAFT_12511 [Oculimacula yallundae]|uniref:Uncharacterized protein n=1 Tax=Oculimacula yallundae TaxID=86028 RepID=A0ABR4CMR3_9HELO